MRAAMIYNFALKGDKAFGEQALALEKEALSAGFKLDLLTDLEAIDTLGAYYYDYDFAIMMVDDTALAYSIEAFGIPVFNNAKDMTATGDKSMFYFLLSGQELPLLRHFASPYGYKCKNEDYFEYIEKGLKDNGIRYPFEVSKRFGPQNAKKRSIATRSELLSYLKESGSTPFVAEEIINGPRLIAYVASDRLIALLEEKDGRLARSGLSRNKNVRAVAVCAIKALESPYGIVYISMDGNMPVITGISLQFIDSSINAIAGKHIGELMFAAMSKTYKRRKNKLFKAEEIKRYRSYYKKLRK